MKDISLEIGRLVLDGAGDSQPDPRHLGLATEQALQRLLAQNSLLPGMTSGATRELALSNVKLPDRPGATPLAEALASVVHRALNRKE